MRKTQVTLTSLFCMTALFCVSRSPVKSERKVQTERKEINWKSYFVCNWNQPSLLIASLSFSAGFSALCSPVAPIKKKTHTKKHRHK